MRKRSSFIRHQRQLRSNNSNLCDVMPNQDSKEQLHLLALAIYDALQLCTEMSKTEGVNMETDAVSAIMKKFPVFHQEGALRIYNEWKTGNPFGSWKAVLEKR